MTAVQRYRRLQTLKHNVPVTSLAMYYDDEAFSFHQALIEANQQADESEPIEGSEKFMRKLELSKVNKGLSSLYRINRITEPKPFSFKSLIKHIIP